MDPPRPDGSACEWHSRGHGFDPHQLHQLRQSLSDERRRPAHLRAAFCVAFVSLPAERSRNPAGQLRPLKPGSASVAVHGSSIRRRTSLGGARLARSRRRSVSRDVRTIRNSLHSIARALTHLIPVLEAAVSNASTPSRRPKAPTIRGPAHGPHAAGPIHGPSPDPETEGKGTSQGAQGHQGDPPGDSPRQEAREGVEKSATAASGVSGLGRVSAELGRDRERRLGASVRLP